MRHTLLGIAFVVALAVAATAVVAQFNREFDQVVPVTVLADRSGLLMDPGAAVKVLGVVVGRVKSVEATGSGAAIHLGLDRSAADRVPADVHANVVPPTVFGAKYVELVRPPGPSRGVIRAGAVISGADVTVEINTTFGHALDLLGKAEPSRFNTALTALADALRGNGSKLGSVITDLDAYLGQLNPSLPTLHQDLDKTPGVLKTYTDITPDLLRIGANAGFTSDTLVGKRLQLAAFLLSLTEFGDHTAGFLTDTERPFVTALDTLRPTTKLLSDYSAMFPCLFEGLDLNRMLLDKVIDGGSFNVMLAPGLGAEPYRYPDNLPVIGKGTGPNCHGLPGHPTTRVPRPQPQSGLPPLAEILFGKAAPR